ncbi:MAG: phosphotransferase [Candidatus Levybacteria bacterium]|nr:phosphotransferase [Candidatus Levybacteria bacterium]
MSNQESKPSFEGLPILTEKQQQLTGFVTNNVGSDFVSRALTGGRIHYVFGISTEREETILKVRSEHYALDPTQPINPQDIFTEWRALSLFHQVLPDLFPRPIAFSPEIGALLTTDIIKGGSTLSRLLQDGLSTTTLLFRVGNALGRAHHELKHMQDSIHFDSDNSTYQLIQAFQFTDLNIPVFSQVANELSQLPRQLVLGDVQSTNIGITPDGNITFFDLELAHRGNPIFDVGFCLGDLILRTLDRPDSISSTVSAFLEGYESSNPGELNANNLFLQRITIGGILFHLFDRKATSIPNEIIMNRVDKILNMESPTWNTLINILKGDSSKNK